MTPEDGRIRLNVATYNVHGGVGSDGRYDPHRSASLLTEIGADIFGLQEVDSRPRRGRDLDQFHLFERATGFHIVTGPNVMLGLHRYGNALLSRWPVRLSRLHDMSVPGCERRGIIDVEIEIGGTWLRVVTTHLGLRRRERRFQVGKLSEVLANDRALPTVVMGDFNLWGRNGAMLTALGHPPLSPGPSWPARMPLLRLDRIWTRPAELCHGVATYRSRLASRASDHLPVVATVELPNATSRSAAAPAICPEHAEETAFTARRHP